MANKRVPRVGELWRAKEPIYTAPFTVIPPNTFVLIVERSKDSCESRVIWDGGTGWVSDFCMLWEPVDEAR